MARAMFRDYVRLVRGFNTFTQLMQCDCINGYAVGRKIKDGEHTRQIAITIYVNKKLSLRRLPISNRIPSTFRLPNEPSKDGFLEFVTDVQVARFASLEYTDRLRPAPSGVSVGHINITAGTLGGLVHDRASGRVVILSNNHVLADSNDAAIGDPILQPGPHDGGNYPGDQIATLTRFAPIDFSSGGENRVDGAIATPLNPNDVVWNTLDIGPETPKTRCVVGENDLGKTVKKTGRTTEHTQGFIEAVFATTRVKYDLFKKATFVDQIIVSQDSSQPDFSNGGDSGSLVYDSNNCLIGLLFAGSESSGSEAGTTIINPINYVMNQLNIELLTSSQHPSSYARSKPEVKKSRAKKTRARKSKRTKKSASSKR